MRIIAGSRKGSIIEAPKGRDVRPTLDRVKESMFGMIQFQIADRAVLDLFAGSGNLGLEALSRGARYAVFNDAARSSLQVVQTNLNKLRFADRARTSCRQYDMALMGFQRSGERFGVIFLDPPYAAGLLEHALALIAEYDLLEPDGVIVAEHDRSLQPQKMCIRDSGQGDGAISGRKELRRI